MPGALPELDGIVPPMLEIRIGTQACVDPVRRNQSSVRSAAGVVSTFAIFVCSALAAHGAGPKQPDFGPNVSVFQPSMPSEAIQAQIDKVYSVQRANEFGPQRNAFLFTPGSYHVDL